MITLLLGWILQPKNAILTAIVLVFLGLFAHDRYLNHEVKVKEENIVVLNKNINELKASIELQNLAITKMNNDFNIQKEEFNKKYESVQKSNELKIQRIKKQEAYVTPETVKTPEDELIQSKSVFKDYLKNRRGLQ